VFDDWNSGYSIRKVSLSRRSGKRRSESESEEEYSDSEQPALSSGPGTGAKPPLPPVFMHVSATRGFPAFFTSAFGTKIVTEPTNYTKLSKKITRRGRQFNKLKPV
jgi:hypothetical protein